MRILMAVAVVAWGAGCGPTAGQTCDSPRTGVCDTANFVLWCSEGSYQRFACPGPNGCQVMGSSLGCDWRASAVGDPCPRTEEGKAVCGADGVSQLSCIGGKWARKECSKCEQRTGDVLLGNQVILCTPKEGTACTSAEGNFCDGTKFLSCEANAWKSFECVGPKKCAAESLFSSNIVCDFTGAAAGSGCPAVFDNKVGFCSTAMQFRICRGGSFQQFACSSCTTDASGTATCRP